MLHRSARCCLSYFAPRMARWIVVGLLVGALMTLGWRQPTAFATNPPTADIAIINFSAPASGAAGSMVTISYTVVNNGADAAAELVVVNPISPNARLVQATISPSSGTSATTCPVSTRRILECGFTAIPAGGSVVFQLTSELNADVPNGTPVTFDVSAISTTLDTIPANNRATATTTVGSTASASAPVDLAVALSGSAGPVPPGQTGTYTVTASNPGPRPSSAVTLTVALPPNTTFRSHTTPAGFTCHPLAVGTAGNVICETASFPAGAVVSFTITVQVTTGTSPGTTLEHRAFIASDSTDTAPQNNRATLAVVAGPASPTQTPSPTATRTSTPAPPTATPFPRANVGVQAGPSTAGGLPMTITARDAGCQVNNQLQALRLTRLTNATVEVPGVGTITAPSSSPVALPSRPAALTLTVRQVAVGQPGTVEVVVTDGCGDWPTFFGGGASAF
jgi:uncharacterized repeat protein (TIGR01451 family)